jgi:hypothetical protein
MEMINFNAFIASVRWKEAQKKEEDSFFFGKDFVYLEVRHRTFIILPEYI